MDFTTILYQFALLLAVVFAAIILYFKYCYTFWSKRNIPYITPSVPFGNFREVFFVKKNIADIAYDLHKEIKSRGCKFGGAYFLQTPILIPTDPAILKHILSTDFFSFSERGLAFDEATNPLGNHLFTLPTKPWKPLRAKLTPTFTSGKIKMMFELMKSIGNELVEVCDELKEQPIDINEVTVRYTVDVIGSCAFGIESNSLKNPEEKFRQLADRVISPPIINGLKIFISLMGPDITSFFKSKILEDEVTDFFLNLVKQTLNYRETNNVRRNDFFQLLLDIKNNSDNKFSDESGMEMTVELIAAQCFVFFAAGFETSSMTINLCLFELAQNLDMQDKVRTEIRKVLEKHGGEITYEAIKEMTYLDCCIQETLRKYPPLGFLNRVCTKDSKIPDTDVTIEKGTKVLISLYGYHKDPEYFPDPERFEPDRFSNENKANIKPFTYLPFGDGHRICIGARFGQVQSKVCLISLLRNFRFTLNSKTKLPIEFQPTSFVIALKNKIYFNTQKI